MSGSAWWVAEIGVSRVGRTVVVGGRGANTLTGVCETPDLGLGGVYVYVPLT